KLKLKIDGRILNNVIIKAELDDSAFEKKEMTVIIDGKIWDITLGDFGLSLGDTEFTIYNKQLKGIMLEGKFKSGLNVTALVTRSMGKSGIYRTTGQGAQQEYRLPSNHTPVVKNSEVLYIDNKQMFRGNDYSIDYEDGSINFNPRALPIENTQTITVEYEYEETSSNYKRNLFAFRTSYNFDHDNMVGFTYVDNSDDKSSPLIEVDSNSAKPIGHQLFDINWKTRYKDILAFRGELAHSRRDTDMISEEDDIIEGNASKINTSISYWGSKLDILHKRIDPNFASVGNKGTSVQGGSTWIVNDIDQLTLKLNLAPFKSWSYQGIYDESSTNILDIEGKEKTIYNLISHDVHFRFPYENNLHLGYRDEGRETILNPTSRDKDTYVAGYDTKIFNNSIRLGYQNENEDYKLNPENDIDRDTSSFNISRAYSIFKYSVGAKEIDTTKGLDVPYQNILNTTLNSELNIRRNLGLTGIFLNRVENNYYNDSKNTSLTADLRLKYTPFRSLRTNFKYKEVHEKKMVRDEINLVTTETPVTTRTASARAYFRPDRRINTQLQYDFRDVEDELLNEKYSIRKRGSLRITVSPDRTLTSILMYRIGESEELRVPSKRLEKTKSLELKKSLTSSLNFSTRLEFQTRENIFNNTENADTQTGVLKIEKRFSSMIQSDIEYMKSKIGKIEENENTDRVTLGTTISAFKNNLKSRLTYSLIEKESQIKEWKHRGEIRVDYKLSSDTNFHTEYIYENVSPNNQGGKGYKASILKSNLEIQF
ncbi:hypothetical protein KAJ27_06950, partial [bacterium]|nr:hypothetical protein [bacterium]